MEVSIGVQNMPREIAVDVSPEVAAGLSAKLADALSTGGLLELTDTKGRTVVVPAAAVGYLDIGPQESRRVGFGSL